MSEPLYRAAGIEQDRQAEAANDYDKFIAGVVSDKFDQITRDIRIGLTEKDAMLMPQQHAALDRVAAANDAALLLYDDLMLPVLRQLMRFKTQADGVALFRLIDEMTDAAIMRQATAMAKREFP
ncbi:MAG: hypothetical protein ACRYGK_17030 [Janthinobacterium lividum]